MTPSEINSSFRDQMARMNRPKRIKFEHLQMQWRAVKAKGAKPKPIKK